MITLSVCNNFWHTYYWEYRPSKGVFYFSTLPISCTYFTLGNCQDLNICKKNLKIMKILQEDEISVKTVWCTKDIKWISWQWLEVGSIDSLLKRTHFSFFLIWGDMLPSHASAEACLTGWPNAQPQGRDYCSVARQANLMVCVVCSCCTTTTYREVCGAKGGIGSGETLCHNIYPARSITTVSLATNTYCMMDGHSSCAPRTVGPRVQFSGACEQNH